VDQQIERLRAQLGPLSVVTKNFVSKASH